MPGAVVTAVGGGAGGTGIVTAGITVGGGFSVAGHRLVERSVTGVTAVGPGDALACAHPTTFHIPPYPDPVIAPIGCIAAGIAITIFNGSGLAGGGLNERAVAGITALCPGNILRGTHPITAPRPLQPDPVVTAVGGGAAGVAGAVGEGTGLTGNSVGERAVTGVAAVCPGDILGGAPSAAAG